MGLFVGQTSVFISHEQLNQSIRIAVGCEDVRLENITHIVKWIEGAHSSGAAHATCRSKDAAAIKLAKDRMLFDMNGVWIARNSTQLEHLKQYGAHLAKYADYMKAVQTGVPADESFPRPKGYAPGQGVLQR